ncbi:bacterial lipocalin [Mizugakiibacter sediminis]|uniref:Bacterial lipocalin n=1 Tax=Mizugakiibacter sediminis TaxID=1475481 RepID=A0A0K8QQ66_9GAMM|nr:lipocalin family protein [Mizugakiibacter sediminis]GAP66846.1 bacterial lipocalin [Mizugakiibacter sediminis]
METYRLTPDGAVATSFRFNSGAADGPVKHIHSVGHAQPDTGNAVWGVQILWPMKAQYVIAYLGADYDQTIVARDARDYVWVMARTPTIPPGTYATLIGHVAALGYDVSKIRKVPQQWPDAAAAASKATE